GVFVDDRERDQVVFVEERRNLVLRRVGRAGDVGLAQLRQLRGGRRDRDLHQRDRADQLVPGAGEIDGGERLTAALERLQRVDRLVDDRPFVDRDEFGGHPAGGRVLAELEELGDLLPLLRLHLLE